MPFFVDIQKIWGEFPARNPAGRGGFSIVETDNPDSLGEAPAKFGTFLDFEIIPVSDITESVRLLGEGVEFRASI